MDMGIALKGSDWLYVTGNGGSATVAVFAGGGGTITLSRPDGGQEVLRYGGLGAGIGVGAKLPRFGKINLKVRGQSVGGAGAVEALPATGIVYAAESIGARDLVRDDFNGACLYVEGGGGIVAGASGTAMLFGLNAADLALLIAAMSSPAGQIVSYGLVRRVLSSARGVIFFAGVNAGAQAGAGVAGFVGGVF